MCDLQFRPWCPPSLVFQTCVFQIVAQEKHNSIKALESKVKKHQARDQKKRRKAKIAREKKIAEKALTTTNKDSAQGDDNAVVDLEPPVGIAECFDDTEFATQVRQMKDDAISEAKDNSLE